MRRRSPARRGVAVVELAVLLPFLAFMFVVTVDWCRVFYYSVTVTNCARNGALYCSDPVAQASSPYANVNQAALADAPNLSPPPAVSTVWGSDAYGPYVEVTVSYPFQTVANFPGIPPSTLLVRTVRMSVAPRIPN